MNNRISLMEPKPLSNDELELIRQEVATDHKEAGISDYILGKLELDCIGTPPLYQVTKKSIIKGNHL